MKSKLMYKKEIQVALANEHIACALAQLKEHNSFTQKQLLKKINKCLEEEMIESKFEDYLKTMTKLGLVYETFSKKGFLIEISPVGNEVRSAIQDSSPHLQIAH
jgi:CTP-dependent riboflavin kinase